MEVLKQTAQKLSRKTYRFNDVAYNLVIVDRDGKKAPEVHHMLKQVHHQQLVGFLIGKRASETVFEDVHVHWYIQPKNVKEPITLTAKLSESVEIFKFATGRNAILVACMPM